MTSTAFEQKIWRCANQRCGKRLPIQSVQGTVTVVCRYCKEPSVIRGP